MPEFCNVGGQVENSIAIETFKDFPQMGRFTLRDEGCSFLARSATHTAFRENHCCREDLEAA